MVAFGEAVSERTPANDLLYNFNGSGRSHGSGHRMNESSMTGSGKSLQMCKMLRDRLLPQIMLAREYKLDESRVVTLPCYPTPQTPLIWNRKYISASCFDLLESSYIEDWCLDLELKLFVDVTLRLCTPTSFQNLIM